MPTLLASYLRVYEPLSAFDRQRQSYWRRYISDGRAVPAADGPGRQRLAVLEALGASWNRLPDLPDEAYLMESEGASLICPWNLRFRVAAAALSARDGVPAVLADAFVPPTLAGLAEQVVTGWRGDGDQPGHGSPRFHEHVSTWTVPLRWFVLVDADERETGTRDGRLEVRYRTEISKARRRAHRALSVLKRSVGEAPISEAVEESARWLEEFHPRSVVELDYGGLATVLSDEHPVGDDSPSLVSAGLAALARGDADTATSSYERLVDRWRAIQLLERSN